MATWTTRWRDPLREKPMPRLTPRMGATSFPTRDAADAYALGLRTDGWVVRTKTNDTGTATWVYWR